jgi:peptidyl-prolyl cis-trans isomerase SurA
MDPSNESFRRALTQYVDETLLVQKALRDEVEIGPGELAGEVDRLLQSLQRRMGGREAFNQWLESNHLTLEALRGVITERERRRELAVRLVAAGITIDADALETFKGRRQQSGESMEEVNLAQILIHCPEEAQSTAEGQELYKQALIAARRAGQNPDQFRQLVAGYSDDPVGRVRGGMLGWLDPNALRDPLREQVARMKSGDVSSPVASSEGFHVLMLLDRRTTRDLAFADRFRKRRRELLIELRRNARIQLYDPKGRAIAVPKHDEFEIDPSEDVHPPEKHRPAMPALLEP